MSGKKKDEMYFSYLSPRAIRAEKALRIVYAALMLCTFAAFFVISVLSPNDTEMTFLGMLVSETALFVLRRGTVPLYEIRFVDSKNKPEAEIRENVGLLAVGMAFLLFIGYVMMSVGIVNAVRWS